MDKGNNLLFVFITKELPFETKILFFFPKYSQKIFLGYSITQFPFSIFLLIFCSKSKLIFFVSFRFLIIFSLLFATKHFY